MSTGGMFVRISALYVNVNHICTICTYMQTHDRVHTRPTQHVCGSVSMSDSRPIVKTRKTVYDLILLHVSWERCCVSAGLSFLSRRTRIARQSERTLKARPSCAEGTQLYTKKKVRSPPVICERLQGCTFQSGFTLTWRFLARLTPWLMFTQSRTIRDVGLCLQTQVRVTSVIR